jgi:hypothetical protein
MTMKAHKELLREAIATRYDQLPLDATLAWIEQHAGFQEVQPVLDLAQQGLQNNCQFDLGFLLQHSGAYDSYVKFVRDFVARRSIAPRP